MFEVQIEAYRSPGIVIGALITLKKIKCPACKWQTDIPIGITEQGDRQLTIEIVKGMEHQKRK